MILVHDFGYNVSGEGLSEGNVQAYLLLDPA